MSDPIRYDQNCRNCGSCEMQEWDDGAFVCWSDYEKLKTENARIRKLFADTERLMLLDGEYEAAKVGTYAVLQAEVNRLRFAGDMLADCLDGSVTCLDHRDVIARWKAEKGGLQS